MAFNDPPSILNGITHPQVIQTPGAGEAIAGGLQAVLGAILQKQQLDQQAQAFQSAQAQRQAETQEAGARTGLYGQETADRQRTARLDDLDRQNQAKGRAAVLGSMATNPQAINDPVAFSGLLKTLDPAVAQHALDFRTSLLKGNEQAFTTQKAGTEATVSAAEAPSKITSAKLEDVLGQDVAGKVATDPNFRRLAAYAKGGLLPLIIERERSAAELARTNLQQHRADTATERAQLHENFRVLLGQNEDDLKLTQGYAQQRSLAQLAGKDALAQFDRDNPKVTPATLEQYHAQQMNMAVPEYRMWRAGILRQGAALMNGTKLAPDEQNMVNEAVRRIKAGKGTLAQWQQHVQAANLNPALSAEVEAQLGTQR